MKINEQFILLQAPNPGAVNNGRSLSKRGMFSGLKRVEDETLYWAECKGSGSNPYQTSLDFSNGEGAPICRCSCPSRQFPCKHAIGLMFEIAEGKPFELAEIPADIQEKRNKRAARKEQSRAPKPAAKAKITNSAAQKKKISRQLEGLDVAEQIMRDLLTAGVSTLSGSSYQSFEKIAKDLGNYYLTGPQTTFSRIALSVRKIQKDPGHSEQYYAEALRLLIALHSTIKKSREFLNAKLEAGNYTADDSILFEALGGVWRLEDLHEIGAYRENARLLQLSFDVSFDEAKKEYIERGYWVDLDSGAIEQTLNLRPAKALKYVKAEDSCFDVLEIPVLYQYPGEMNRRVRWENCGNRPVSEEDIGKLISFAAGDILSAVKVAKGQFKNTLLPKYLPMLLPVAAVGSIDDELVLADSADNRIKLRDIAEFGPDHNTLSRLRYLPCSIEKVQAMFGLMFFDESDRSICFQPYSVINQDRVIRLLF